ncbi:winged helix-turn-helix domain-containing protein [Acinetobacter baumannii]
MVDVHISKLRQKLDIDSQPPMLKTIRNAGYMLTDE